ncbi:SDR family NAD(P)-dependent oxidoreductase [uncultured Clostridium sp.]|uniref:SDR family NAD(P)-dependent oxidoreductase n=1 Tax=uncultured Clostridium sp. TaxID=59620 RepID=UPI00262FDEDA|nr:SDR family NAD(P)-dependent oxidoreductase [uncultured Clostridium sp.]
MKKFFSGKAILIIGGTGTIGKGLIKELIKQNPSVIRIFSRDEYKQFEIQNHSDFVSDYKDFRFLIGDVRDYERVERAMEGIDIVFNLAAMKHVGSCEYNPTEAIKTNVDGMNNVIKAAIKHNIECVLFTSSDKAINPVNTYGATKMLAEKLVQAANYSKGKIQTKFIAVRFGNVMGSRGSVIPLFKKQILEQKRITVTDPTMNRFMMSLSNAVNLMMKACEVSIGGELFILKMPVVNIGIMSEVIVEEVSKKYDIDKKMVKIDYIGSKAGEKYHEELMTVDESHYAKDLGDMIAVMPTSYNNDYYKNYYKEYDKCEFKSYSAEFIKDIEKQEVRNLIISEGIL